VAVSRLLVAGLGMLLGSVAAFAQASRVENAAAESARNIHRREQWFAQGRVVMAHPDAAARYRALQDKMKARAIRRPQGSPTISSTNVLLGDWVPLGPAPEASDASGVRLQDYNYVAGRATAVAVDAADSTGNTVYIGGAYGGVWKSINAGPLSTDPGSVAWGPLTDDQATLAVGAIAIQPQLTNPNPANSVILVGTGEANGSVDSYYGLGILRSGDAGKTWMLIQNDQSQAHPFAGLGFSKIAFSTTDPTRVVAATSTAAQGLIDGKDNPSTSIPGIYYSSDSGLSWNYATVKDGSTPTDAASVTSVVYNAAANTFFAAISSHGIYSSQDGATWMRMLHQPEALQTASCPAHAASPSGCPMYRGEFAVVPGRALTGNGEMYFWYLDGNDADGGIWTSSDAGGSWSQINDGGITSCGDLFGGCGTAQGFYNLALQAVANGPLVGGATDLYAGAVNLYKCTISVLSPNCSGAGTFLNLTHVYGCSSIARVHPAQHAMASMLINNGNEDLMYFANDGGIYRALDGYTGLLSGSCGSNNEFASLNQTLGSMTQVVSFSESSLPQNPTTGVMLAGAQANGSPGTVSADSSTGWQNFNAGDGGYTAISPTDDNLWFVSNPPDSVSGVNIFMCGLGVNCHTQDFQNHQVVSGAAVGGDAGGFNTPYILDPQNPAEIIVGTCRVWRGPVAGGAFTDLSYNFETGFTGICSGNETNVVRSLAAGGSAGGLSKVIYAGTDGTGPLAAGLPTGGHVWVSTNVGDGLTSWFDRTGTINPQHFPISTITVDTSDNSGLTAYVGIMGFNVTHVWKTVDGGVTWDDFNFGLPDAPVNALLADGTGTIYAGTDVGVYASATDLPNWNEVGPAPDSSKPGFLPNVAVTGLHLFGASRRLRVSTYGRGIWELAGFNLSRPVPESVAVNTPGTTSAVTLLLTSAAFSGQVNLSCSFPPSTPAWAQCNFLPGGTPTSTVNLDSANPVTIIVSITTTADAPNGPFNVGIHAASPEYTTQTQNLPVTVFGGFSFSITNNSGAQIVPAGQTATYDLTVAPSGGNFSQEVNFTCSGLPLLSTCGFAPMVVAAWDSTTDVKLSVVTPTTAAPGAYTITVTGVSNVDASAQLPLTVQGANSDFSLSNSTLGPIAAGASATYDITVTPTHSTLTNSVTLSFQNCPASSTCSFDTTLIPTGSGVTHRFFTVATAVGLPAGAYSIGITGTSNSGSARLTLPLTITGPAGSFDFSLTNDGPATVAAGASHTFKITATPSSGVFPNSVSLVFVPCESVITCTLGATEIPAGNGVSDVTFTINTTSRALAERRSPRLIAYVMWLTLPGMAFVIGSLGIRRSHLAGAIIVTAISVFTGCGGLQGGSAAPALNPGTPPGTYTVKITATSGLTSQSTQVSLTIQ
jgi:hypothetical protein